MYERRCSSWEDFRQAHDANLGRVKARKDRFSRKLLFRGQANARWPLATTLDRKASHAESVFEYYLLLGTIKSEVESFTNKDWGGYDLAALDTYSRNPESFQISAVPHYAFMVYLRHHGFPSPLLDWSRSLYVAAFFAFADPPEQDVAIYVYWERPQNVKSSSRGRPLIQNCGPNVVAHKRHFLQQAEYTICLQYDDEQWMFAHHDSVTQDPNHADTHQDLLWKYVLPASERRKVLAELNEYNLNAFSLFGNDESLMHTLWERYAQGPT